VVEEFNWSAMSWIEDTTLVEAGNSLSHFHPQILAPNNKQQIKSKVQLSTYIVYCFVTVPKPKYLKHLLLSIKLERASQNK